MKSKTPCKRKDNVKYITLMNRAELSELWTTTFGNPPPAKTSQSLMQKVLSFEIQSTMLGALEKKTKKKIFTLQRQIKNSSTDKAQTQKPKIILKPGTRLLREWKGATHCVEVIENGFVWQGNYYRSLSAIARLITGAHWSGPRFFGITTHNDAK